MFCAGMALGFEIFVFLELGLSLLGSGANAVECSLKWNDSIVRTVYPFIPVLWQSLLPVLLASGSFAYKSLSSSPIIATLT